MFVVHKNASTICLHITGIGNVQNVRCADIVRMKQYKVHMSDNCMNRLHRQLLSVYTGRRAGDTGNKSVQGRRRGNKPQVACINGLFGVWLKTSIIHHMQGRTA